MKLTITLEVTDLQAKKLCHNSIERVINMSVNIASDVSHGAATREQQDAEVNLEDWKELAPLVRMLWVNAQDAARRGN